MKKDMSDIIHFLKVTLIWYDFTGSRFANFKKSVQYFRVTAAIVAWFSAIVSNYIEGFTTSFDGKYYFIVILLLCWCHSLDFCIKKDRAVKIVKTFQAFVKTQNDCTQEAIFETDSKNMWAAIKLYGLFLFMFAITYFISPFVIDTALAIYNPESKIFKVPLCFDGLMDGIRNWKYYLLFICSSVWPIEAMFTNTGSLGALCIFITYLGSQIKILAQKVDTFSANVVKRNSLYNPTVTIEENKILKDILEHHTTIIRLSEEIKQYFGFSYANQNLIASICLCINMVSSVILLDSQKYFLVATNLACCYIVAVLVFTACYLGEYLETQNTHLYYALCNVPWYALNSKVRKDINLMILNASKGRNIDFHGLSALKLHTFMQIMNTSYSYFMVLKSLL